MLLLLLLLLNYVVLRALWKIDVHLISPFINKSLYYYYIILYYYSLCMTVHSDPFQVDPNMRCSF